MKAKWLRDGKSGVALALIGCVHVVFNNRWWRDNVGGIEIETVKNNRRKAQGKFGNAETK